MQSFHVISAHHIVAVVLLVVLALSQCSDASIYLPQSAHKSFVVSQSQSQQSHPQRQEQTTTNKLLAKKARYELRWALKHHRRSFSSTDKEGKKKHSKVTAMAIPGYGITEQIFVGGFLNFLNIYNLIITARILLSWFPQAQSVGLLQPVYAITDPYLNLFRGIIPPLFGLDFSPLLAFFLLSALTNATAAIGADIPTTTNDKYNNPQQQQQQQYFFNNNYHNNKIQKAELMMKYKMKKQQQQLLQKM